MKTILKAKKESKTEEVRIYERIIRSRVQQEEKKAEILKRNVLRRIFEGNKLTDGMMEEVCEKVYD